MFDSSAPLSLADEPSGLEDSFISAASSNRVDRLEKDVATLSKRLDQEERARKRLQELLSSSGIAIPQDLADSQAWYLPAHLVPANSFAYHQTCFQWWEKTKIVKSRTYIVLLIFSWKKVKTTTVYHKTNENNWIKSGATFHSCFNLLSPKKVL